MTMNPDENAILAELDWDPRTRDPVFRLLVGAGLCAAGGIFVLLTFTFSILLAMVGLGTMGLGIGAGVVPGLHALVKRISSRGPRGGCRSTSR